MSSESQHLADALVGLFSEKNSGWYISFRAAVDGLTAEQAVRTPGPGFNSVWVIVNHLIHWNNLPLQLLQGVPYDDATMGGQHSWIAPDVTLDEATWRTGCERLIAKNRELAAYVAKMTDDDLAQPLGAWDETRVQTLHGVIAHNSYHICEIISIRHMQGFWIEKT